ncbi:hypothetical protein QBC47DRAFT_95365 [Echria macrotheca]|uniref:DUF7082 domain-containing protein n=1 Tax=Echria macrotheca TaxID=438768 RepID=A0AAJ0BI78_9PEZI|nr:hypothetical protein QBC47DRAFT_95365 [Echria macrotheca]
MSLKFDRPAYKVYEPGYHPHRTIILDEQIESPETLTIRLAEEAARGGGDLSGDSPTGLLPMSAYKSQPPQLHGYADPSYSQQSSQGFATQQSETASQINQLAFAANSTAAGQYLSSQATSNICVHSCHPKVGSFGTKVSLKVESEYDLAGSTSSSAPFVWVQFGSQRCQAEVKDCGVCTYDISAEAPQFLSTTCPSLSNVPLTLIVESANGAEIARVNNAGTFSYHNAQSKPMGGVDVGGPGDTSPSDLGSPKARSPVHRHSPPHPGLSVSASTTSPSTTHGIGSVPTTNAYGFPPSVSVAAAAAQAQAQAQSDYISNTAGAYNQGPASMLGTYRSGPLPDHYPRVPPILRSPHGGTAWTPFGNHIDSIRSPTTAATHSAHAALVRPGYAALQHSPAPAPALIRTSTLTQQSGNSLGGGGNYNPYGLYQTKATLEIHGDLQAMAENWTQEEWDNKRRLVMFKKKQNGSVLTITFKPVSVSERPPNSICISCIWWQEREECFVTSVDTIHLLEQLLAAPSRFSVEEKNRIRRNLEGFHPLTVSKAKPESEEFFKVIMGFGNPKPRNIEKDVKVFTWKTLGQSLSKIISKYSASTATLATPVNIGGQYPPLPPASGSATATGTHTDAGATAAYMSGVHHHPDSVVSPSSRRLSSSTSWSPYGSAALARTMSPIMKTSSPMATSGLRISTIPAVYDSRGSAHSLTSPYSVTSASHANTHHTPGGYGQSSASTAQTHARNWDSYSVPENYSSHGGHSHYGGTTYGEGTQRA